MTLKRAVFALLALLVLAVAAFAITGGPLADIKPASVRADDPDADRRGRALLAAAYEAHGGDAALRSHQTATFTMRDTWFGVNALFNPWPDADQHLRMTTRIHSFDSAAHLLNGPEEGVTWGITDGRSWRLRDGSKTVAPDADIEFMLPTTHYFTELPQRLTEAELVRYVGEETIADSTFDVVFATWGSLDATEQFDQYLVYIDKDTGRIGKIFYTVREIMRSVSGTAHLDDQRSVDGWWVPHRMTITATPSDDPEGSPLHRMVIEEYAFDVDDLPAT